MQALASTEAIAVKMTEIISEKESQRFGTPSSETLDDDRSIGYVYGTCRCCPFHIIQIDSAPCSCLALLLSFIGLTTVNKVKISHWMDLAPSIKTIYVSNHKLRRRTWNDKRLVSSYAHGLGGGLSPDPRTKIASLILCTTHRDPVI